MAAAVVAASAVYQYRQQMSRPVWLTYSASAVVAGEGPKGVTAPRKF